MINKVIRIGVIVLMTSLLLPFISATESFIFKQGEIVNLELPTYDNDLSKCVTCSCDITILYPNGTNMYFAESAIMSSNYVTFSIPANETTNLGVYKTDVHCSNGADYGIATFEFLITPLGEAISTPNALFYFGVIIMLALFLVGTIYISIKSEKIWVKLLFMSSSYLIFMCLSFIFWQVAKGFISNITFITDSLYMIWILSIVLFLPFLLFTILYLLNIAAKETNKKMKLGMGYSKDEI